MYYIESMFEYSKVRCRYLSLHFADWVVCFGVMKQELKSGRKTSVWHHQKNDRKQKLLYSIWTYPLKDILNLLLWKHMREFRQRVTGSKVMMMNSLTHSPGPGSSTPHHTENLVKPKPKHTDMYSVISYELKVQCVSFSSS